MIRRSTGSTKYTPLTRKICEFFLEKDLTYISQRLLFNPGLRGSDIEAAKRLADVVGDLRLAADALRKIHDCVSSQVKLCEEHIVALRLRGGFASLPDEILTNVLEHAAIRAPVVRPQKHKALDNFLAARRLSHACQRFRSLMLRSSTFWRCVWSGMSLEMVKSLCGRLAEGTAEIFLDKSRESSDTSVGQFIRTIASLSDRWSRFTQSEHGNYMTSEEFIDLAHETNQLHVPLLSQLVVGHPKSMLNENRRERAQDPVHYYSTWSAPQLRVFHVRNMIPVPFTASSLLTTFRITLECGGIDRVGEMLSSLIQFLASCSNLKIFGLKMFYLTEIMEPPIESRRELAGVESLEIEL